MTNLLAHPTPKINIGLSITKKRMDGFHDLETLFYPIDAYHDTLSMTQIPSGFALEIEGADFDTTQGENICQKTFHLFMEKTNIEGGCYIKLTKQIPSGAGLGGGSADAACCLKLLNQLFAAELSLIELKKMALQLGSDVPFFMDNRPALAKGRGEILTPVALDLSAYHIEIKKPSFNISTAEAYSMIKPRVKEVSLAALLQAPITEWRGLIINDFEEVLFPKYPELAKIKADFYQKGALYASLSGSGSAVYGIFEKK
ncbi:MAG: 4-(cytidine 5'-diphospho)-2-C-methyl-D-erythritol kinase [Bacteroidales bacterium]|jgi:4-diphosphocytidyl-2-C-methyl-D-erythritol kinase|nr:4-(cytidine 5'-diphospho)-2-C-methyl-D-erythritol kinase [Bacteroidales bacterium]